MVKNKIKVSIIIVNYKTHKLTEKCINSVFENTKGVNFEVIVVDNASNDESVEMLKKLHRNNKIKLLENESNLGFSAGNNVGIKKAGGDYVLLLNSDTELKDDVISHMANWMEKNKNVGISTCSLRGIDGNLQSPGGKFPNLIRTISWMTIEDIPLVDKVVKPFHVKNFRTDKPVKYDWVTGTFFLIRCEVIDKVGLLDESFFMYTEEVDYCYRVAAEGWDIYYVPQYEIIHYGKASSSSEFALLQEFKGVKLFYKKHYPMWHRMLLNIFIKLGTALRVIAFSIIGDAQKAKIYAKAFTTS